MSFGTGDYKYELVKGWAKVPQGWDLTDVSGLGFDKQDRVFVFSRSDHPVTVFDRDGNLLSSWGEGFGREHNLFVAPDGSVFCADDGHHIVSKFTPDGKLLQVLGNKDKPSDTGYVEQKVFLEGQKTIKRSGPPFHCPTDVFVNASGEIFVSDGYGNARVHKFSPDGKLLFSFGEPGGGHGQFKIVHALCVDKYGRIWVCDRENYRIQIFDAHGKLISIWSDVFRPGDLDIGEDGTVYVAELTPAARVSVYTFDGKVLARWDTNDVEKQTGITLFPHTLAVDSRGDIYVGQITHPPIGTFVPGGGAVQKFARVR